MLVGLLVVSRSLTFSRVFSLSWRQSALLMRTILTHAHYTLQAFLPLLETISRSEGWTEKAARLEEVEAIVSRNPRRQVERCPLQAMPLSSDAPSSRCPLKPTLRFLRYVFLLSLRYVCQLWCLCELRYSCRCHL